MLLIKSIHWSNTNSVEMTHYCDFLVATELNFTKNNCRAGKNILLKHDEIFRKTLAMLRLIIMRAILYMMQYVWFHLKH